MSAPKLARLKVVREHLIPIYLEHFDRNELSEQTAYALARMETALQERLANMSPNLPTGSRAEELLGQLSDTHREKQELKARLRWAQGRREEAWVLVEQELFNQALTIQSTLMSMLDWALKEEDRELAQVLADTAVRAGEVFELSDYAALSTPFQLAAADQDGPKALALLDRLLHSLTVPWDLAASPLYSHLPTKDAVGEDQRALIPPILDSMERDQECAFLRETPGYAELIQRYRNEVT